MDKLINQRYLTLQILGQGGFGSVFRVADQFEYGKTLALKKIKSDVISTKAINVFKHEFKFLISLVHPNLVKVYDFDIDKDTNELFFTMEYIQGKSLFKSLKESFSWEKVENNLIQASRALSYIHSKDIIHYDIKPDNIFIDDYGKLKIMDFGFAGSKNTTEIRGTMQFIAPELIQKKNVTHKIDFFSLGVTFYFSITGKLPFKGKDKQEIISNAIKGEFVPLEELRKDIPKKLVRVISKMMQPDPDKRYDNADEIIMDLVEDPQKKSSVQYLFTGMGIRSYISSGKLIGRKKELSFLMEISSKVFKEKIFYDNKPIFLIGRYGNGKSSILREYKYLIQLNENIDYFTANFIRGDETTYQAFEIIILEMFRVYRLNLEEFPRLKFLFENDDEIENYDDMAGSKLKRIEEVDAMAEFICSISRKNKFVLELKDFDNSNSPSINLLERLAGEMRRYPEKQMAFMIVTTVQIENLKSYHKITIKRLRENIHKLDINPLALVETREYVTQLLMETSIPEEVVSFIHKFTGGVPYYINELMIYLFNNNYLNRYKMKWILNPSFLSELTLGLREITFSNFKRFSIIEQAIIKELMIIGRPAAFDIVEIIAKVTMVNRQIIIKFLQKLTDSEVIEKIKYYDGYRYYLGNKLFHNSVVKDFQKDEYPRWNEMTAKLIEKKFGVTGNNIYALADYYFRCQNRADKAIVMLESAINKSFEENNLEFAVTNLKRLQTIETDPQKNIDIFIKIIQNQTILGSYDTVLDQLVKFENEKHTVSDIDLLKIKLIKFDCASKAGRYDHLDNTREWLINFKIKRNMPKEIKASYFVWLGDHNKNNGRYEKSLGFYKKAMGVYKKSRNELLKTKTLLKICKIKILLGNLKNIYGDLLYSLDVFTRYNEIEHMLDTYCSLGDICRWLNDRSTSLEYYEKCNALAKDQNDITYEVKSSHRIAEFEMNKVDIDKALEFINCGVEKPEDVNIADLSGDIYYNRALIYYQTGQTEDAIFSINRSKEIRALLKRNVKLTECFFLECRILLRMYKTEEARKILQMAEAYFTKENRNFVIEFHILEALVSMQSDKHKKALKTLQKIEKTVESFAMLHRRIMFRVIKALVYDKMKDYNRTVQTVSQAHSLYVQNDEILKENKLLNLKLMIFYDRIRCYAGDQANGIKDMSNIIQFLGNHELSFYKAQVNYNLGRVYMDMEENYRALSCFKLAKKEFEKYSEDYPELRYSSRVIEEEEMKQDNRMPSAQKNY
jgi:serine/threonine protein kinase/tetratricopeptide (TPR) repeat protein